MILNSMYPIIKQSIYTYQTYNFLSYIDNAQNLALHSTISYSLFAPVCHFVESLELLIWEKYLKDCMLPLQLFLISMDAKYWIW
jgi:hypothetical protein